MQGMKLYLEDLRRRIVQAVEGRASNSAAARLFGVSLSSVKRYSRIAQRGVALAPRKGGGRPPKTDQTAQNLLEEKKKELRKTTHGTICHGLVGSKS
jgi:transposase